MVDIDSLTLGELRLIQNLTLSAQVVADKTKHPLVGKVVVAVLPHGFIYFGKLDSLDGHMRILNAQCLRYWAKRDSGLLEFAEKGPIDGDKIDSGGDIFIGEYISLMETGDWCD